MKHLERFLSRLNKVRKGGCGWRACCPLHVDQNSSMSIGIGEGGRILLNCHVCGSSRDVVRGILKAVELDWPALFPPSGERVTAPAAERVREVESSRDLSEVRNHFYSFLGSNVGLTDAHHNGLRLRGLSHQHVVEDGYFSVERVTTRLMEKALMCVGEEIYSIPGFVRGEAGRPEFYGRAGLFVPIRDAARRVYSGQIRRDTEPKYLTLPASDARYHVPLRSFRSRTVWVTEGALKADVAASLSGESFVGVLGVNSWQHVLPLLRKWEVEEVVIAFDRDTDTNPQLRKVKADFKSHLIRGGYLVSAAEWDAARGNGIDDLLAAGFQPNSRGGDGSNGEGKSRQGQSARAADGGPSQHATGCNGQSCTAFGGL